MPVRHYCTYFDHNYLYRALALYESLAKCSENFLLWVLCFDDLAFEVLSRLNLSNVRSIALSDFEQHDPELAAIKNTRLPREYYWSSTASLIRYTFDHAAEADIVAYLDSDLYFFSDPEALFTELQDGSVLIVPHHYAPDHEWLAPISGVYNVGTLLFRRDEAGQACLNWWRERCIEWCYAKPEDGKFGDQKYLDEFPERFKKVITSRKKGAGLAPWNLQRYQITQHNGEVFVDDERLVFYHFHSLAQLAERWCEQWSNKYHLSRQATSFIYPQYLASLRRAQSQILSSTPTFNIDYSYRGPRSLLQALIAGRLAYLYG